MKEFLKPKVSVLTCTYAQESYITDTLDGVLKQQYDGPIEFIIANDNSPDKTDEVVKNYFAEHPIPHNFELKYTRHESNKGMMGNFVWVLEQASGKYIALCEGDDYWTDPLKLQKQVDFLEDNEKYILIFHPVKILNPDGMIVDDNITNVPENYELQETLVKEGNYIHTPSVVFRKVINSYPDELKLSPIGDYFLYLILTNHGMIKMLEDYMGIYRYGVGVFSPKSKVKKARDSFKLFGLLLSWSNNIELNKILIEKQLAGLNYYADLKIKEEVRAVVSDNLISRLKKKLRLLIK